MSGNRSAPPDLKTALTVKSWAVEFMKEQVFGGDFDHPRLSPDANGMYHYTDKRIHISCSPSHRDAWLNCIVRVFVVRRRWLFRTFELVLSTGYGVDLWTFRHGQWVDYLSTLAKAVDELQRDRESEHKRKLKEEGRRQLDRNFSPIDDSSIFKK